MDEEAGKYSMQHRQILVDSKNNIGEHHCMMDRLNFEKLSVRSKLIFRDVDITVLSTPY